MRHFSDCAPTTQFGFDGPAISNSREKKLWTDAAGICFRGLSSSGNYNVERVCEAKAAIAFVSLSKDPRYARASHVQARYRASARSFSAVRRSSLSRMLPLQLLVSSLDR